MSHHRDYGRGAALLLPAGAAIGWAELRAPLGAAGLVVMVAAGLVLGVMLPALVLSLSQLPLLLIPRRWLIRQREGYDDRPYIPRFLRHAVYAADGWRCRYCGEAGDLQLDHIRPWSCGGLSVIWNMMTLCGKCNRVKSNYWIARDGYVFYKPFRNASNAEVAAAILQLELRHRWRPMRWIRAGWSLSTRSLPVRHSRCKVP